MAGRMWGGVSTAQNLEPAVGAGFGGSLKQVLLLLFREEPPLLPTAGEPSGLGGLRCVVPCFGWAPVLVWLRPSRRNMSAGNGNSFCPGLNGTLSPYVTWEGKTAGS